MFAIQVRRKVFPIKAIHSWNTAEYDSNNARVAIPTQDYTSGYVSYTVQLCSPNIYRFPALRVHCERASGESVAKNELVLQHTMQCTLC